MSVEYVFSTLFVKFLNLRLKNQKTLPCLCLEIFTEYLELGIINSVKSVNLIFFMLEEKENIFKIIIITRGTCRMTFVKHLAHIK
jgi:hypothetical protein